jgi:hypothetical protein
MLPTKMISTYLNASWTIIKTQVFFKSTTGRLNAGSHACKVGALALAEYSFIYLFIGGTGALTQ